MDRMIKNVTFVLILLCLVFQMACTPSATDPREPVTAIVNVNVIPMTEKIVLYDQVILVAGDQIIAVGNSDEVETPRGANIIDGNGAYVMPGLADMHVHIYEESRDELPVSPLNLYIAKGVTTIRDCGTAPIQPDDTFVLDWRDEILKGETIGPMIYSSGRTIHGPVSNPGGKVAERHKKGFDFAKLYMELSFDEFTEAQTVAEELGMYTVGHIPYQVGHELAISQGLDEIAHLEELSFELMWSANRPTRLLDQEAWLTALISSVLKTYHPEDDADVTFDSDQFSRLQSEQLAELVSILIANNISVGTTLAVYEAVDSKLFDQEAFLAREETAYLFPSLIEEVLSGQNRHQLLYQALGDYQPLWKWKTDLDIFLLQELHKAGVNLVSGTDAGSSSIGVVEGFATHDDLRILVQYGFTPYEALLTATVNAAHVVEKMGGGMILEQLKLVTRPT
jgi:imidazolonepropionase-like amidohydrolase